jgi:hypothetical protein
VVFLQPAVNIVAKFLALCVPVLIGAEAESNPDYSLVNVLPKPTDPFGYLNSGTYIGRASDIKYMLAEISQDVFEHYEVSGGDVDHVNDQVGKQCVAGQRPRRTMCARQVRGSSPRLFLHKR